MTFSGYGSVAPCALGVCVCEYLLLGCGGCWDDVEQAQWFITPRIMSQFVIACSSQSKATLTCT